MRWYSRANMLFIIVLLAILTQGCSRYRYSSPKQLQGTRGYSCSATAKYKKYTRTYTAWAPERRIAWAYALSRCQSHSKTPDTCKVKSCWWTGGVTTVSDKRWFTCYAMNRHKVGVWSSTSHKRLRAITYAFKRCQKYSGWPRDCYFSYCRLW